MAGAPHMTAIIAVLRGSAKPEGDVNLLSSVLGFCVGLIIFRRNPLKKLQTAVACLALASAVLAQTNSSGPKLEKRPETPAETQGTTDLTSQSSLATTSNVAPDKAVITIEGLCEKPGSSGDASANCKTVVTRAEFEKIINAVQPNMPLAAFANRYAVALYLAERAHALGLDQGPNFDEKMHIARLQVLAQMGGERIHQEAANVTDSEIERYYHEHITDYKTVTYDHLMVPKQKQIDPAAQKPGDPDLQKKREASEAEMKAEADKLRARAAAGEDFTKLQQEAYDVGGYTNVKASNTRVDKARKDRIPPAEAAIFELKAGEVSQVFADAGGFAIYKIDAIEDLPLANVRDEISRKLTTDKERGEIESLQKATKLDDAYFAAPAPPTLRNPGETAPAAAPAPGKN